MVSEIDRITEDLFSLAKLVIVAMFLIVIVYLVAQQLFGMVPAAIGTVVIGIPLAFIYATNDRVRDSINSWARRK
jgi:positive regulator of sigma E activity